MGTEGLTYALVLEGGGWTRCVYQFEKTVDGRLVRYPARVAILYKGDKAIVCIDGLVKPIHANDLEHAKAIAQSVLSLI